MTYASTKFSGFDFVLLHIAMQTYLSKKWGTPRLLRNGQILKNGIFFQTGFSGGVTGHLDIMFRKTAAHAFYNKTTYYWH